MPGLNHHALICELSKAKTITKKKKMNKKNLNGIPVVENGAKQEGVIL